MIVQILAVFEIWCFLFFFLKKLSENLLIFFLAKFEILNPVVWVVRLISKIENLAFKNDCSILCSFREKTFFVIFFKNVQKT